MPQKSSTFIQATRERETWLPSTLEREQGDANDAEQFMATAALLRGVMEAIPVPEEAEEQSRAAAVAHMQRLLIERGRSTQTQAPWYLRLGHLMRYVFTLGRRR